jgi:hypothetical protein
VTSAPRKLAKDNQPHGTRHRARGDHTRRTAPPRIGQGRRSNSRARLLGDRPDVQRLPQIDLGDPKLRPRGENLFDKRLLARRRYPNRKLREIIARRQRAPEPRLRALDLRAAPADRIPRPLGPASRLRQPVRLRRRHCPRLQKKTSPLTRKGGSPDCPAEYRAGHPLGSADVDAPTLG